MAVADITGLGRGKLDQTTPNETATHSLSLPGIHCAGCISKIEKGLSADPMIAEARVNLSLKRVRIVADKNLSANALIARLKTIGFQALELDSTQLSEAATEAQGKRLLIRLGVAGFAAMNVMLLSVAVWSGAEDATRDFLHWISAAIALPTIAFAAQPFFTNALSALKVRRLNMDVPISLAIILAAAMSLFETSQGGQHAYFDAALSLTFFLLAGRYLDHKTRASARSAAQELAALDVARATKVVGAGKTVVVAVDQLEIGDFITVKPGGRIPVDGVITQGTSEIDRALLTGESLPVFSDIGTVVHGGEVNLTGPLTIKVTATASGSALHQLAELVAVAENARTKYTSLADRAAAIYAPGVHILAALALVGWLAFSGDLRLSVNIAIAVLIITCPCALGLAVPAVTTAASGRLFSQGILLKSGTALERLADVDTVIFDKTGTLTLGTPKLTDQSQHRPQDIAMAAALGQHSNHPMAQALVKIAAEMDLDLPEVTTLKEVPGFGIQGQIDDKVVRLGRASWLGLDHQGPSATFLQVGTQAAVGFTFVDRLREGAKTAIEQFQAAGLNVILLSGDTLQAATQVAQAMGITDFAAPVSPEQKAERITNLQAQGHRVLMVGDGLNDTGALRMANVSISPASAIDAARVASDMVMLRDDLAGLGESYLVAKSARRRIKENFAISVLYNLVAVPVALLGFATPLLAALAMSASSLTVTLNAWRVRW